MPVYVWHIEGGNNFVAKEVRGGSIFLQCSVAEQESGTGSPSISVISITLRMCLWTEWYYVGDLVADSVSQLLVLDMESFCETLSGAMRFRAEL